MKLITTIILTAVTIIVSLKAINSKASSKATTKYWGDDLGFE